MVTPLDLDRLEHAVRLYLDLEHPEAWEALAEIVAHAREAERLQENKTCRHCGWSGAPYHVVCPSCFTLAIETARQAKELEARIETLTAALETYGRHLDECNYDDCGDEACEYNGRCFCGFDQARGGG